jgi:hypothetical protein
METRTGSSFGIYNISSGSKRKGSARVLFSKKTVWYCSPSSACNDPQYFERMAAEINLLEERVSNLNKLAVDSKNYLPSSIEYLKKNPIQDYQLYFIEIESVLDGFSDSYPELSDEILLTSVDSDGSANGYDLELIKLFKGRLNIPVILNGGMGKPSDAVKAIENGADAVAAAYIFHFSQWTPNDVKLALSENNIPVRSS